MQWNKSYGFESYPKTVPQSSIPQIVGEGNVTPVTFPDGSVQFYFIPTIKQNHLTCPCNVNPYGSLFSCPNNTEVWFVRCILHPQANVNYSVTPGYLNGQLPSTFVECPPYSPPNNYMDTYQPTYQYTQKFHNDKWTSTTDIHYFYPSLRRAKYLQYCTETQTEIPFQNNTFSQNGGCNRPCHCETSSGSKGQRPDNTEHNCHPKLQIKSSDSCMSVDSGNSESRQGKNEKYKKKPVKNKKNSKRDPNICGCKEEIRNTADETYADQATGDIAKNVQGGRETKTKMSKSKKQITKASKTKAAKLFCSSESCCCSRDCACTTSTSENER